MTPPTSTTPPASPAAPQAPGAQPGGSKAIVALVLGILSLICCGFFSGIPAIIVGRSELKAIDEGRSPENNRTLAKVGYILGLVGSILSVIGIIIYALIFGMAFFQASHYHPSTF